MAYPTQEALRVATWHFSKGDFPFVESICRRIIAEAGAIAPACKLLGLALFRQEKHVEAAQCLKIALLGMPEDNDLANAALLAAYSARAWDDVINMCTPAFTTRQTALQAMRALGMAATGHIKMGRGATGREQFQNCLKPFLSMGLLDQGVSGDLLDALIITAIGAEDMATLSRLVQFHKPNRTGALRPMGLSPLTSLAAWCKTHGVKTQTLDREQRVDLAPEVYTAAESWTACLPKATMVVGWDFPIASTGEVLEGSNYLPLHMVHSSSPHYHIQELDRVAHVWADKCIDVDEDALLMSSPEGMHFGHWLVDFLPRLRAWKRPMKIAIPDTLPAKHRDTMACFGVEPTDLIECAFGGRYRFRTMTVVVTGNHKLPQPENPRFVYRGLARNSQGAKKEQRLFVNRGVGTRQVANSVDFGVALKRYGFKEVNLAEISIPDQRALLAETRIAIGVYGSDLFCMYMMPPGSDILELVSEATDDIVFARYSAILGMNHRFVQARSAKTSGRKVYKKDHDIDVDCTVLAQHLDDVVTRRTESQRGS